MNAPQHALAHWLNARKHGWDTLENQLKPHKIPPDQALVETREVLSGYRAVMNDLSLSRRLHGDTLITRYLLGLFVKTQEELARPASNFRGRLTDLYHLDIPPLMRTMQGALFGSLAIFVVCIVIGWSLVSAYPELASLFASEKMIETVQGGQLWTDDMLNVTPSSLWSLNIATNNITVTLFAFALGAFYGVGTLYIIGVNGLMLGGLFAFTASYGLGGRLFAFVVGHGVVELSVILIAGAMGLQLGEALIRPGQRNRLQAFQETCVNTGKVLLAATPFLVLAGLIEGFISPSPRFGMLERTVIGGCTGTIFWLVMYFGLPWRPRP